MPAPKGNQYAKGNKGGPGAKSLYEPRYAKMAYRIALLGSTNADIARIFDVSESTISAWVNAHEDFAEALKRGRDEANGNVAASLYRRALGYKHKAIKIFADAKTGAVTQVPYVEHYAPDTTAAIFWLKNRRPDLWRDRVEHTGANGGDLQVQANLKVSGMTVDEREARREELLEKMVQERLAKRAKGE